MLGFVEIKVAQEQFYAAKISINIWDVNIDNKAMSILIKTKSNSKYLIGCLDELIRPLVLMLPKMNGYVKTFKIKGKNN